MEVISEHLKRIQQVDQIARDSLLKNQLRLPEKYANIEATLKLLANLIAAFRKRADGYELELKQRAKIDDLSDQIRLHRARIADCERLSESLAERVGQKRGRIAEEEGRVRELRRELVGLKTDNVKKILLLQELEDQQQARRQQQDRYARKATWKLKTQFSRGQLQTNLPSALTETEQAKIVVAKQLHAVIERKGTAQQFIEETWRAIKLQLSRRERKANLNGLNGSLMFKMLENEKRGQRNSLSDPKLMIYDVLRAKLKAHRREERECETVVSEEQFMGYSAMQVLGMIELRGGLGKLRDGIDRYERALREGESWTSQRLQ